MLPVHRMLLVLYVATASRAHRATRSRHAFRLSMSAGEASSAVVFPFMQLPLPSDQLVVVDSMATLSLMQTVLFAPVPLMSSLSSTTAISIVGIDCEWEPENYEYRSKTKKKEEESNNGLFADDANSSGDQQQEDSGPQKPRILRTSTVSTLQVRHQTPDTRCTQRVEAAMS